MDENQQLPLTLISVLACLQAGNPCLSNIIRTLKTTYRKQCWDLGYAEQSAKSMTAEKHMQLMTALHREGNTLLEQLAGQHSMPACLLYNSDASHETKG